MKKTAIYIFSYNRPKHLSNCLDTIKEIGINIPVFVVDDNSEDIDLQKLLASLPKGVLQIKVSADIEHKIYGGLYFNMNIALDHAIKEHYEYAIFIQDDTQFVRRPTEEDFLRIERFFIENEDSFEILVGFEKRRHIKSRNHYDASRTPEFKFRTATHQGHKGFCDVGLFHVARVRERIGGFLNGERENEVEALSRKIRLGIYNFPFMMWLPFPSAVRSKQQSRLVNLSDRLSGAGCHPIQLMSIDAERRLFECSSYVLPRYAEDWLICETIPHKQDWSTEGAFANLIVYGGVRAILGRIFAFLYSGFRKLGIRL